MGEFVAAIRRAIQDAQGALIAARQARRLHEVNLHRARLRDLLEVAARSGVHAEVWLDPAVRSLLSEG